MDHALLVQVVHRRGLEAKGGGGGGKVGEVMHTCKPTIMANAGHGGVGVAGLTSTKSTLAASLSEKARWWRMRSSSSPPRISSITMYTLYPSSYTCSHVSIM